MFANSICPLSPRQKSNMPSVMRKRQACSAFPHSSSSSIASPRFGVHDGELAIGSSPEIAVPHTLQQVDLRGDRHIRPRFANWRSKGARGEPPSGKGRLQAMTPGSRANSVARSPARRRPPILRSAVAEIAQATVSQDRQHDTALVQVVRGGQDSRSHPQLRFVLGRSAGDPAIAGRHAIPHPQHTWSRGSPELLIQSRRIALDPASKSDVVN